MQESKHRSEAIHEADTGYGPVDFKISGGFNSRVLVEIKLSRNNQLIKGYTKQLEAYKAAEGTHIAYYLIVDVGNMGNKLEEIFKIKNEAAQKKEQVSEVIIVDGTRKQSASKLT